MRHAHDLYFHRGIRFDNKLAPIILYEERRVLLQAVELGERVRLACRFESLAVASRPLQRLLDETNFAESTNSRFSRCVMAAS